MAFVQLHAHSEFSPLDGLSTPREMAHAAREAGQPAIAITDHGTCAGHPTFQLACAEAGVKPIFGLEAYFVDDRFSREGKPTDYDHLVLWAMNDEGLKNLWAMSTESYRDGLWGKYARLDWDTLSRLNEGVMCSTACLGGPISTPYLAGNEDKALSNLLRLREIFGDRLYVEIHANQLEEQIRVNEWLVDQCVAYRIDAIAVVDSHYPRKEDRLAHRVWLSAQIHGDVEDTNLFSGNQDYHLMTEDEVRSALSYLPQEFVESAISNTVSLAERCSAEIEKKSHNPIYSKASPEFPDRVAHDCDRLLDVCLSRWEERTVQKTHPHSVYEDRFSKEYAMIVDKGFAGYFLMVWDMVSYAKRNGVLVGPARGSGGGSLVAYLLGITELDPVEHDVLFERFMTKGRTELPDFDIDFPRSKKNMMFEYVAERWGADHVATVGTHMRMKNKSVIQAVARAMKNSLDEDCWEKMVRPVSDLIDDAEAGTAGLGLSWEQLMIQIGDILEPYRRAYPTVFEMAEMMVGRLRTYGKHPAGVIIDPDNSLVDSIPLRMVEEDGKRQMVAQFDLSILDLLGYTKFDMLNLRNLDTLQGTVDLIHRETGRWVNPYNWREELEDPYLFEQISEGWTLGLFQIETKSGTQMSRRFKPSSLGDLADILTLVRPGPSRSGLTEQYLRRRKGAEEVSYPDDRMEKILSNTEGSLLYQEQLMSLCMTLAQYDDVEADKVRKILGKKKVDLAKKEGISFVRRAVANGTDAEVAQSLWGQMEEFAKYCLVGETRIHLASSGRYSDGTITVAELYRRLHSSKFHASARELHGLSYFADGRIRPARIVDVIESGVQLVFRITLSDGKTIDATAGHRHLTPLGYREVQELRPGNSLIIDAGYQPPASEDRRRRWQKGHLAAAVDIASIESIGDEMTYDVVMEDPHNFVANGIVTHNSFGFGHAMGYATLTMWTAWFKFHYPLYFLTASLSTVKSEMVPAFIEETRRLGYRVLPPDINESGKGFSIDSSHLGVRYGIDSIKGIGEESMKAVIEAQPYKSWDDFLERKGAKCNAGHVKTMVKIGVFDSLVPHRRWLEKILETEAISGSDRCQHKVQAPRPIVWIPTPQRGTEPREETLEHQLPCGFDWRQDKAPLGRTGKPTKKKAPPKKCTRACRHFTPTPPPSPEDVEPYTPEEIRDIEAELIGVYLSSTPFDRIPAEDKENLVTANDLLTGSDGNYMAAVIVNSLRETIDKNGNRMAFLSLATERGSFDCTAFNSIYSKYSGDIKVGSLAYVSVNKNERGQTLDVFMALD